MNILLTGSSGFLGSYINDCLASIHAITSLGRSSGHTIQCNLAEEVPTFSSSFDVVIHSAGYAHVIATNSTIRKRFFDINYRGTQRLCEGLEQCKTLPKQFVFISTVSVYGLEHGNGITEEFPLQGTNPYARSKVLAEQFLQTWCKKHGIKLLIFRPPLIAGLNPKGNLGRMIEGMKSGRYLSINKGYARKSVVLAQDIASLIKRSFDKEGIYNLTDGDHPSFAQLERIIVQQLECPQPISIPLTMARLLGWVGDMVPIFPISTSLIKKMSLDLIFDDTKARKELGWNPRKVVDIGFIVQVEAEG